MDIITVSSCDDLDTKPEVEVDITVASILDSDD